MDVPDLGKSKTCRKSLQRFYSVQQLAELFDVDVRSVYRWIENGGLHAYKIGGVWRISEEDLKEFLEKSRV